MKEPGRGRVVAGRYELDKLLGQGGMGEVWVATDRATSQRIALKLLKAEAAASKEQRGRFEREARIARSLQSPHLTRVSDAGVDEEGTPYMAMEILEGEDLQKRIKSETSLPVTFVVNLAIQVGRALHVAHQAGLVHRDLKPANIFLARQNGTEVAKVLDFGIAKGSAEASEFTTAGEMLGTASYMSPEQIRNAKTVTHQADLWALAVVLFRALTGKFPFPETGFELFLALTQDPLPTPIKVTSLVSSLPPPLNVFFERAFTREVERRYPNASAMIVGFCRAAGVTVPADVLSAADSGVPQGPVSGQFPAVQLPPSSGNPPSGQPLSGASFGGIATPMPSSSPNGPITPHPISSGPMTPVPTSPSGYGKGPVVHEHAPESEPAGLSGTLMLDAMPDLAASAARAPLPAAGRLGSAPSLQDLDLDPEESDNASTLFYQPGAQAPMDIRPPSSPALPSPPTPGFGSAPDRPRVFTAPLDQVRAAAAEGPYPGPAGQSATPMDPGGPSAPPVAPDGSLGRPAPAPARPNNRSAGIFLAVIVVVLLGGAAFAVLFLMKG